MRVWSVKAYVGHSAYRLGKDAEPHKLPSVQQHARVSLLGTAAAACPCIAARYSSMPVSRCSARSSFLAWRDTCPGTTCVSAGNCTRPLAVRNSLARSQW
jgi:hypothetical protein